MGWKSIKNGELLALAEGKFDLFITADQGLAYEQNLRDGRIAILELSTNKLRAIEAVAAQLRDAIATMFGTDVPCLKFPLNLP